MPLEEEPEEEVVAEPGGVELAKPESGGEAESEATMGAGAEEVEEVGIYHPVVPELLVAFTDAVELLEKLAEGRLTPSEAKAEYVEKVKLPVEAVAIDTTEKASKKARRSGRKKRKAKS